MLSRITAKKFFAEAIKDIRQDVYSQNFQLVPLVNRSVNAVISQFYGIMANDYMTEATFVLDEGSRFASAATGSWTAATFELSHPDINDDFELHHANRLIVFKIGDDVFNGFIQEVINTQTVIVTGDVPSTDGTVDFLLCPPTSFDITEVSLENLRMMRSGKNARMELHSNVVDGGICDPLSFAELNTWEPTAVRNSQKIVYCYHGNKLKLKKSEDLDSFGTLTLSYPRIPFDVISENSHIDLPHGAPIEIAILKCQLILASRFPGVQIADPREEMARLVRSLFENFGITAQLEEIKNKVEALL
jgi:hypothetical protein